MRRLLPILVLLLAPSQVPAQTLTIDKVLIRQVERPDRPAVAVDSLEAALALGTWTPPRAEDGWREARADSTGWIDAEDLRGGYAYAEVEVPEDSIWLLDAMGYIGVYVNGEPRVGNVYGYTDDWASWQPHFDFSVVPVRLHAGVNRFLFFGSRYGLMRARLTPAPTGPVFNARDVTLPDLVVGRDYEGWGSIVVMNPTGEVIRGAVIAALVDGQARMTPVPPVPPLGVRKVGFEIVAGARNKIGAADLKLVLDGESFPKITTTLPLEVKGPHANRRETFISGIDGSVQYYGFLPAAADEGPGKALVLSLHGASVEALNQSGSYARRAWADIVAPTNRRPFGFSWEDWGRRDALEVLDLAQATLRPDPDRVYLTGHSMGGHGSWHLATLYPDRFAAVGPSAGWISIWSYRQDPAPPTTDPLIHLIERGTLPSRTLEFAPNLAGLGVYVLHGTADDNVPIAEAHLMLERLAEFHNDVTVHEEPEAGHWWDRSSDAGADCVNWPPMFDFFARHRRPVATEVSRIDFRTPSPSLSSQDFWVEVLAQQQPFLMSRVRLDRDVGWSRVDGETWNIADLALDWSAATMDSVRITLDGDSFMLAVPADGRILLRRDPRGWTPLAARDPRAKGPANNGGFRSAFAHRPQLVYGTGGTREEKAWALAKARYDAEWLWYQGNASVDVLPDTLFDPTAEPDRSVVLYGHQGMHEDWDALVDDAVQCATGYLEVAGQRREGGGLAVLAVRPRPGSDTASVGVVAATGPAGCRLLNRRPYLALGVAYPDVVVFQARASGQVAVGGGYFGGDWSTAGGTFVWESR